MRSSPLTGENDCAAHPTNGRSDVCIAEANTIRCEAINRRGPHDCVTGATQRIVALIIGKEEENVGAIGGVDLNH